VTCDGPGSYRGSRPRYSIRFRLAVSVHNIYLAVGLGVNVVAVGLLMRRFDHIVHR